MARFSLSMPLAGDNPDKRKFIEQQFSNGGLGDVLSFTPNEDVLTALSGRHDDLKYFFVKLPTVVQDELADRVVNRLHRELKTALSGEHGALPGKNELYGLTSWRAYDLFQVARINAVLKSEQAEKISSFSSIKDAQLDNGLPPQSIIPVVNLFCPDIFDAALKDLGVSRTQFLAHCKISFPGGWSSKKMLKTLRRGYVGDNAIVNDDDDEVETLPRISRYRISRTLAEAFCAALANAAGRGVIVDVESVFPASPIVASYGYRRRTRPLSPLHGNPV